MTIEIDPKLESRLRERAAAEGLSISDFIENLLNAEASAEDELQLLAFAGLTSGEPIATGPGYWIERHRLLDEALKKRTPL
jgi:hypothetical protein